MKFYLILPGNVKCRMTRHIKLCALIVSLQVVVDNKFKLQIRFFNLLNKLRKHGMPK